jgi:inosine-uridine nucleoside N-ribohydrolase
VTEDQLEELRAAGGPKAEFLLAISRYHMSAYRGSWEAAAGYTQYGQGPWVHFNDAPCTAFAVAPELFKTVESFVGIETRGTYTDGQTVMDLRGQLRKPANARVCLEVDGRAVARRLVDSLSR